MAEPGSVADLVGAADAVVGFTGLALEPPGPVPPTCPSWRSTRPASTRGTAASSSSGSPPRGTQCGTCWSGGRAGRSCSTWRPGPRAAGRSSRPSARRGSTPSSSTATPLGGPGRALPRRARRVQRPRGFPAAARTPGARRGRARGRAGRRRRRPGGGRLRHPGCRRWPSTWPRWGEPPSTSSPSCPRDRAGTSPGWSRTGSWCATRPEASTGERQARCARARNRVRPRARASRAVPGTRSGPAGRRGPRARAGSPRRRRSGG